MSERKWLVQLLVFFAVPWYFRIWDYTQRGQHGQ